jgi:hypothetical protein
MSAGGNICPFSFRTRFSRVTLLLATVSTKDHQYLLRGNKTKKETKKEEDVIGWFVWIVRGHKLPLSLSDEPGPKLVVGCQG